MSKRRPSPIQDLMLAYRAEAAESERWLAEITEALGLPATATQAERVERARALAAQMSRINAEREDFLDEKGYNLFIHAVCVKQMGEIEERDAEIARMRADLAVVRVP